MLGPHSAVTAPLAWILSADPMFARRVRALGGESSYAYQSVMPGSLGGQFATSDPPALLLIDRDAPACDVPHLVEEAAEHWPMVAVVVVCSEGNNDDITRCLRAGADDCLVLPMPSCLFQARLCTVRRRSSLRLDAGLIRVGDLSVDRLKRRVRCGGAQIALTGKEYVLLDVLMRSPGVAVSRAALLAAVWEGEGEYRRINGLEVHLSYLRRKLRVARRVRIDTIRGQGYTLVELPLR